jgi:hypothetical protein
MRAPSAIMLVALAGSAALPTTANITTATTATISKAQQDLQAALNLYGIAKGIGEVAAMADPAIGPIVAGITAVADPVVAQAQTALNDASTDAAAIEALSAQITAQANAMTVQAAPSITVIPTAG